MPKNLTGHVVSTFHWILTPPSPQYHILVLLPRYTFYNVLSVELQEAIRHDGYTLPNNSTLSTLSSQTSVLQVLREKAVVSHKLLREEKQRVLSILNSVSLRKLVGINPMYSRPSRPLVKGNDGKFYPNNPITNYISRFADEFSGCLGCRSEIYLFRGYPDKHTSEMKKIFFLDLNTHVLSTRNEEVAPISQSNNVSPYTNSSHSNTPAHQNNLSVYTN